MKRAALCNYLSIGLAGCLMVSCAYGPSWHEHPTRRPAGDVLVGRYQLIYLSATEEVLRKVEQKVQEKHQKPSIVLKADSSFVFVNVPTFSQSKGDGLVFVGMGDATGHWSVAELGMAADIFGRKKPYYGLHLEGVDELMSELNLDSSPHHHLKYKFIASDGIGAVMTFCPSSAEQGAAANRRPALQSDGSNDLAAIVQPTGRFRRLSLSLGR